MNRYNFLDKFTDYSTAGSTCFTSEQSFRFSQSYSFGYTLDKYPSPVERPGLSNLSLFAFLQITELLASRNIIVLNLNEFNNLVNKVVYNQLGAIKRSFKPISTSAEQLREFEHICCALPNLISSF